MARISCLFAECIVILLVAVGTANSQQAVLGASVSAAPHPMSLEHCYWHFLMYQNHLDARAAEQAAQGNGKTSLGRLLQTALQFSDADFAPIRSSSIRLSTEVKALDAQAGQIAAAQKTPTSFQQLRALTVQREADINAEVSYLRQTLGPAKTAVFEAFITQLFAPKAVAIQINPSTAQPTPAAVQP